jgi:hypothetical protein
VWPLPDYPQYYDDDESDTEIRRIKREEALKMLEEGAGATSEGEEDDVKSVGSYDFADARAKKVLADKRVREEHNSRGNPSNDRAPSPEYPGKGKGRA